MELAVPPLQAAAGQPTLLPAGGYPAKFHVLSRRRRDRCLTTYCAVHIAAASIEHITFCQYVILVFLTSLDDLLALVDRKSQPGFEVYFRMLYLSISLVVAIAHWQSISHSLDLTHKEALARQPSATAFVLLPMIIKCAGTRTFSTFCAVRQSRAFIGTPGGVATLPVTKTKDDERTILYTV